MCERYQNTSEICFLCIGHVLLRTVAGFFKKQFLLDLTPRQNTRSVRKVSSQIEYLENHLGGLDITWQSVRGDLIAHS